MKQLGITLLFAGFFWIVWDAESGFAGDRHSYVMISASNLPSGEAIKREDAVQAMGQLSWELIKRHKTVLLPALIMLAGGLLASFDKRKQSLVR